MTAQNNFNIRSTRTISVKYITSKSWSNTEHSIIGTSQSEPISLRFFDDNGRHLTVSLTNDEAKQLSNELNKHSISNYMPLE